MTDVEAVSAALERKYRKDIGSFAKDEEYDPDSMLGFARAAIRCLKRRGWRGPKGGDHVAKKAA